MTNSRRVRLYLCGQEHSKQLDFIQSINDNHYRMYCMQFALELGLTHATDENSVRQTKPDNDQVVRVHISPIHTPKTWRLWALTPPGLKRDLFSTILADGLSGMIDQLGGRLPVKKVLEVLESGNQIHQQEDKDRGAPDRELLPIEPATATEASNTTEPSDEEEEESTAEAQDPIAARLAHSLDGWR